MLAIIDYGVGNLRSVYMAFRRLGVDALVTSEAGVIRRAKAVVLPGVGAFGDAIGNLRALGLEEVVLGAIRDDLPFLGICVGLQLLFEASEEMGEHRGLGVLPGRVRRFPSGLPVPHMGWNQIHPCQAVPLWRDVPDGSYAYFVHSYYADAEDPTVIAATTDYGIDYVSAVARGNLFAIQFHPEKSQDVGERILANFLNVAGLWPAEGGA
ncbi:MAG: imidazole glycerol phosphate synthase subunit HisH [Anaerolineae bacterium]|nr:imidazole glycerol phosphate synthase subunit HisH [Anaerolineae bacterium]